MKTNSLSKLLKEKTTKSNTTKKTKKLDFNVVNDKLRNAKFFIKSEINNKGLKSVSILIESIRLVSLNEIFATLQNRKYEIFKYKTVCHDVITKILDYHRLHIGELPVFNKKIRVVLFRQSNRYIDSDSFIASFKYFVDAFVEYDKPKMVLDDDPNFIKEFVPEQVKITKKELKKQKGENFNEDDLGQIIGLRFEEIDEDLSETNNFNPYEKWGFISKLQNEEVFEEGV